MITTSKVKEILEAADVQVVSVTKINEENPMWEVQLEYQVISNHEIDGISKELNDALINLHLMRSRMVMYIHPYYTKY